MLAPDTRTVAMEMLRPPAGYRLDGVVLTSYSLDLDVLLALPLAILAQTDQSIDQLLEDPLLVLEALREAGRRIHVFVDAGGIARPQQGRELFTLIEQCVHPVQAPNGGAFHPKVWLVRFVDEAGKALIRAAVASRNLTFDRSWDVALVTEASPESRQPQESTKPLSALLRSLPDLGPAALDVEKAGWIQALASEIERARFPAPAGFEGAVAFEVLGMGTPEPWHPVRHGTRLLAIAPFLSASVLRNLAEAINGPRSLVSRLEALDELPEKTLEAWEEVLVLSGAADAERTDEDAARPSGLHAKLIGVEDGNRVSWLIGSANLTAAAFSGRNVEAVAWLQGPRAPDGGTAGIGIEHFKGSGFPSLCEPYIRTEDSVPDPKRVEAQKLLEATRDALLSTSFQISCTAMDEHWSWRLNGGTRLPEGVSVTAWPITINEARAQGLEPSLTWTLPVSRLTVFAAFRLSTEADVEDLCFTLKLPAEGLPDGREDHVLRMLIDTPDRFMQFLRALLGGIEGMADWAAGLDRPTGAAGWDSALAGETLLDDLLRAASREPRRLEPIRRLIADLSSTPEGRNIIPDDFYELWRTVEAAISRAPDRPGGRA